LELEWPQHWLTLASVCLLNALVRLSKSLVS
jgi:hypothetical protein